MSVIIFDMFPASGHYSAILKMAKVLNNNGFRVVVSGSADFREKVEKQGLEYLITNPLLLIPEKSLKALGQGRKFLESRKAYQSKQEEEWMENFNRLKTDIQALQPSLVLLDEQNALKAGAYVALGVPVVFFQTKPDTRRNTGIPPFTSYYLPRFTATSNGYCRFLWLSKGFMPAFRTICRKLKLLKTDDLSVLLRIYREIGLDWGERIDINRSFGVGIKGFSRIVVSPAPFDFPHEEMPGVHRIGPLTNVNREGKIDQPRYQILIRKIEEYQSTQKGRVIYASMGTITGQDAKRCTKFFLQMGKIARMNPEHLFILSTGNSFDVNLLLPTPNNMLVFETVPQVDLLQKCDVMITHGGMNSITECVFLWCTHVGLSAFT